MNKDIMFSSEKKYWETPQKLFEALDDEFHFTLDVAASDQNHKCKKYFTEKNNGLLQDWSGETCFCNPPYGNIETGLWTKKYYLESRKPGTTVVMLLPARTDRISFHQYILHKSEIRFLKGRLCFEIDGKPILNKNGRPMNAPFPSMIVIFRSPNVKPNT